MLMCAKVTEIVNSKIDVKIVKKDFFENLNNKLGVGILAYNFLLTAYHLFLNIGVILASFHMSGYRDLGSTRFYLEFL